MKAIIPASGSVYDYIEHVTLAEESMVSGA